VAHKLGALDRLGFLKCALEIGIAESAEDTAQLIKEL
jgi:hypothetical protein